MLKISATVNKVLFPREDVRDGRSHFYVLLTSVGKAKGELPFHPAPGTRLSLVGQYEAWHGEKVFRFTRSEHEVPVDPRALLDYAAKLSKGVGQKTAEKIWNEYGASWREHLGDMAPSVSVPLSRTVDALFANREKLNVTMFCLQNGIGPSVADRIFDAYGSNSMAAINADPYCISSIGGIGFKTADAIAEKVGICKSDMRRAVAAVDYALSNLMEQSGDSVVGRDALYRSISDLDVPRTGTAAALAKLVSSNRIVYPTLDAVTTRRVVDHEGDFVRYVSDMSCASCADVEPVFDSGFAPDESQLDAVRRACSSNGLSIVNGGAGAGKTTIIKAIAKNIMLGGGKVRLCAFAGKAAARLREATGLDASTIHSMLGWTGEGRGFSYGDLCGETVIVDEASMIPSSLLYEITKRNPKRLVLVGDQAQLQPVGIGSPFHDAIDHLPSFVSTLTTCYRNKEAVFANALRIRNGECPSTAESRSEKFSVVDAKSPEDAHTLLTDAVIRGDIDFAQDAILAPRNGEGEEPAPCTVNSVNEDVQRIVNPHAGERFRIGDRVMCTRNFPNLHIWNGTTGFITRIDTDGNPWFGRDDGGEVRLHSKDEKDAVVPAYCITVHKSQGSQYRDVYIVVLKRDASVLMDRSMLYTAVTRARRACYVICDDGLDRVVNSVRRRRTYLQLLAKGEI